MLALIRFADGFVIIREKKDRHTDGSKIVYWTAGRMEFFMYCDRKTEEGAGLDEKIRFGALIIKESI